MLQMVDVYAMLLTDDVNVMMLQTVAVCVVFLETVDLHAMVLQMLTKLMCITVTLYVVVSQRVDVCVVLLTLRLLMCVCMVVLPTQKLLMCMVVLPTLRLLMCVCGVVADT